MNLTPIFARLESIEREAGRLYRLIAQQVSERFPELVALFSRLADEESDHEKKISLAHALMREAERKSVEISTLDTRQTDPGFDVIEEKTLQLDHNLDFIREKISLFSTGLPEIKLSQIVAIALDIELQMQESHQMRAFELRDPEFIRLMESLSHADEGHISLLRDWLGKSS